jgi:hypothetical protein
VTHDHGRHPDEPGDGLDDDELDGPIDPYTGRPGTRPLHITPMGQVDQYGLVADGVHRTLHGRNTGWRRIYVPVGLALLVLSVAVMLIAPLADR